MVAAFLDRETEQFKKEQEVLRISDLYDSIFSKLDVNERKGEKASYTRGRHPSTFL
jgi:hypothetical protein